MEIDVRHEGNHAVVALAGEVDLDESPRARETLLAEVEEGRAVLVDLGGVKYIDSSGIASLVEAFQRARAKSTSFALANVSPEALRVLQLARLDKVFPIHATLADGLASGG